MAGETDVTTRNPIETAHTKYKVGIATGLTRALHACIHPRADSIWTPTRLRRRTRVPSRPDWAGSLSSVELVALLAEVRIGGIMPGHSDLGPVAERGSAADATCS